MDLRGSATRENLMRAFAGESQARNRYTFAAENAGDAGMYWVERIFRFTANQEKEHAHLFFKFLIDCAGENIAIEGAYPVENTTASPALLLRSAQRNEYDEALTVYPAFAKTAKDEGFSAIAAVFERVAAIEKTHGDRFGLLAQRAEEATLYKSDRETAWLCLACGHVHVGLEAPPACPVCRHSQGYFVRVETEEILAR